MTSEDNSIPQNAEGEEYLSFAITPMAATTALVIRQIFCFGKPGSLFWTIPEVLP